MPSQVRVPIQATDINYGLVFGGLISEAYGIRDFHIVAAAYKSSRRAECWYEETLWSKNT